MYKKLPIALIALLFLIAFLTRFSLSSSKQISQASTKENIPTQPTASPYPTQPPQPTPTSTPTPTTPMPIYTTPPTPTYVTPPTFTPTPTTAPILPSLDVSSYLISEVNRYRTSLGLGPVQTSSATCDFALIRAQEISINFSHDGFHIPYATMSHATENLAQTSNYQDVVPMWIGSTTHAENLRADTPFACIKQYGDYYAFEGMKP